jgi:hypothetical protein
MDLLTVVEHELGHALGFEHSAGPGVMEPTLAPGVRLTPGADPSAGATVGNVSSPSIVSNLSAQPLSIVISAPTSGTAMTGTASAQTTALPTQSSPQIASPTSAPSVLTTIGSTSIAIGVPSSSLPNQTLSVLSGITAATDGIAAVGPDFLTVSMPLPPRVETGLEGDGRDSVLRDRKDLDIGELTDQLIRAMYLDGIPVTAPVEKDPTAGVSWKQGCESFLKDEELTGWFVRRDKVAARTQGEDEVLDPALQPIAAVAAFGMALSACTALTSQTSDLGLGGLSSTAQPKTSATKRRPGRSSRSFPTYLRRQVRSPLPWAARSAGGLPTNQCSGPEGATARRSTTGTRDLRLTCRGWRTDSLTGAPGFYPGRLC